MINETEKTYDKQLAESREIMQRVEALVLAGDFDGAQALHATDPLGCEVSRDDLVRFTRERIRRYAELRKSEARHAEAMGAWG